MKALVAAHAAAEQFLVGYRGKKPVRNTGGGLFGYAWHRNADRLELAAQPSDVATDLAIVGAGSGLISTGAREPLWGALFQMNFIAGGESWPVTGQHAAGASIAAPRAIAHSQKICQRRFRALNRSRGHAGFYRQAMLVRRPNNFWLLRGGVKPKRGS